MNKIMITLLGIAVLFAIPSNLNEAEPELNTKARLYCIYMEQGLLDEYLNSLPRSTDIFTLSGSEILNVCGKLITDPEIIAKIDVIEQIREMNCDWQQKLTRFSDYCWINRD